MLVCRTDLAVEAAQLLREQGEAAGRLEGVQSIESLREGYGVTTVRVLNEQGAQALGKPQGTYVTLELDGLLRREEGAFPRAVRALAAELNALLPLPPRAPVLVAGLGNRAITPDAVGPKAADNTLVTRHLVEQAAEHFGSFRPVTALAAGVLGTTGMESGELLAAVVEKIRPACVLAVDALAARSAARLCRTVQLADTGITPGAGVGNSRKALNAQTLGVPVVAIGVPTVVDAATLARDLLAGSENGEREPAALQGGGLIVTPKDIDAQVADISKVIGYGINLALQPGLTVEDVDMLLS